MKTTACISCFPYKLEIWSICCLSLLRRFLSNPRVFITTWIPGSDNRRNTWRIGIWFLKELRANLKNSGGVSNLSYDSNMVVMILSTWSVPNVVIIWDLILCSELKERFMSPQTPFKRRLGSCWWVSSHRSSTAPRQSNSVIQWSIKTTETTFKPKMI